MKQYSKRMVIVHWLTLAVLIAAWYFGDSLAEATDESKATLAGYIVHLSVGGAVLLLTLSQLYFRRKDGTPPLLADTPMYKAMATGFHYITLGKGVHYSSLGKSDLIIRNRMFHVVVKGVHYLLYAVSFLLPASGVAIILTSKAGSALLAGDANLLPKKDGFEHVFAHDVHEQLVTVLIVLAGLHILAVIVHQFTIKGGVMSRMSLRRKD